MTAEGLHSRHSCRTASSHQGAEAGSSPNLRGSESDTMSKGLNYAPALPATAAPSLAQFDTLPESAHVRLPVVAALHGVGPATVWRWVKAGRLPAPVKLGPNTTAWRVGDLRRVMASAAG